MGSQYVEVESEAWYRAIAEGRLLPVSDRNAAWPSSVGPQRHAPEANAFGRIGNAYLQRDRFEGPRRGC
jgi:hypothetical protein